MSCGATFINISESSTRTIAQGIYAFDRATNGLLVPPTVANAAARTALTPTLNEIVFQSDTNELYRWDGAAWQLVGSAATPVFGESFAFDRNTTVTNTTATFPTFTEAHKFTYNAANAGDYLLMGFYRSSKNVTTTDIIIRVQEDDTTDIHSDGGRMLQQEYKDSGGGDGGTGSGTNQRHTNTFFDVRTLGAGNHDFDIDLSRSGGGGGATATVYDSLMLAFRVS